MCACDVTMLTGRARCTARVAVCPAPCMFADVVADTDRRGSRSTRQTERVSEQRADALLDESNKIQCIHTIQHTTSAPRSRNSYLSLPLRHNLGNDMGSAGQG